MNGYNPNQLVFDKNSSIAIVLNSRPPNLEGVSTREIITSNLNTSDVVKRSFIKSEKISSVPTNMFSTFTEVLMVRQ